MICPECGKTFENNEDFVHHLTDWERLTKQELYGRIVNIGLLTKNEIDACLTEIMTDCEFK